MILKMLGLIQDLRVSDLRQKAIGADEDVPNSWHTKIYNWGL